MFRVRVLHTVQAFRAGVSCTVQGLYRTSLRGVGFRAQELGLVSCTLGTFAGLEGLVFRVGVVYAVFQGLYKPLLFRALGLQRFEFTRGPGLQGLVTGFSSLRSGGVGSFCLAMGCRVEAVGTSTLNPKPSS